MPLPTNDALSNLALSHIVCWIRRVPLRGSGLHARGWQRRQYRRLSASNLGLCLETRPAQHWSALVRPERHRGWLVALATKNMRFAQSSGTLIVALCFTKLATLRIVDKLPFPEKNLLTRREDKTFVAIDAGQNAVLSFALHALPLNQIVPNTLARLPYTDRYSGEASNCCQAVRSLSACPRTKRIQSLHPRVRATQQTVAGSSASRSFDPSCSKCKKKKKIANLACCTSNFGLIKVPNDPRQLVAITSNLHSDWPIPTLSPSTRFA